MHLALCNVLNNVSINIGIHVALKNFNQKTLQDWGQNEIVLTLIAIAIG